MAPDTGRLYGSIAVAKEVGISLRQLYYWVNVLKVVQPQVQQHGIRGFCRFTSDDVARLKAVKRLMKRGYTVRAAVTLVKGTSPSREAR